MKRNSLAVQYFTPSILACGLLLQKIIPTPTPTFQTATFTFTPKATGYPVKAQGGLPVPSEGVY